MTTLVLFHHALGQTRGFLAFAEELRRAGHVVHTPDLYGGRTFDELREGVDFAERTGMREIVDRGRAAAADLPTDVVYAGFSLGIMPAQSLTQTKPGARGAILYHGCVPTSTFGTRWPDRVPLQINAMEADEWADVDVAKRLTEEIPGAELFLFPGEGHLFADPGVKDYDPQAARLLKVRTLAFLDRIG